MDAHWQFVIDNEAKIRRMCKRFARPHCDADELYAVVIDRIERLFDRWDPDRGEAYIWRSLFFWMVKRVARRRHDELREEHESSLRCYHAAESLLSVDVSDESRTALDMLDDEARYIVVAHVWAGDGFREISQDLGIAYGSVVKRYNDALRKMRDGLSRDQDEDPPVS